MTHTGRAEKIWQLINGVFEHHLGNVVGSAFASEGQSNEIQFRLMKSIAGFKQKPSDENANLILADCNLIHAMGWLTDNELHKIEVLLGDK